MLATDEAFHQTAGAGQPHDYLHPFIQFLREGTDDGSLRRSTTRSRPPTSPSTPLPGRTSTCAAATTGPRRRAKARVVGLVLNGIAGAPPPAPTKRRKESR